MAVGIMYFASTYFFEFVDFLSSFWDALIKNCVAARFNSLFVKSLKFFFALGLVHAGNFFKSFFQFGMFVFRIHLSLINKFHNFQNSGLNQLASLSHF
jgi:hypothetical protein